MEGKTMGFESYVSESEAASYAGVSVSTLRRFTEAGYFKVETEQDGLILYPRSELAKVFGIKGGVERLRDFPAWQPPTQAFSPESNGAHSCATEAQSSNSIEAEPPGQVRTTDLQHSPSVELKSVGVVEEARSPEQYITKVPAVDVASKELELLVERQKVVLDMHERLLSMKEERIKSLEDEREWLRARVEKLEEKASRDQLLLLSETQTIKALITIQEQRRSPVRAMLEWFGFVNPPAVMQLQSPQSSSIDVTNKAA